MLVETLYISWYHQDGFWFRIESEYLVKQGGWWFEQDCFGLQIREESRAGRRRIQDPRKLWWSMERFVGYSCGHTILQAPKSCLFCCMIQETSINPFHLSNKVPKSCVVFWLFLWIVVQWVLLLFFFFFECLAKHYFSWKMFSFNGFPGLSMHYVFIYIPSWISSLLNELLFKVASMFLSFLENHFRKWWKTGKKCGVKRDEERLNIGVGFKRTGPIQLDSTWVFPYQKWFTMWFLKLGPLHF